MDSFESLIDVADVDGLKAIVARASAASYSDVVLAALQEDLGRILQSAARRANLDEDMGNLMRFSRCVACEVLSSEKRKIEYPNGCWSYNAPHRKREAPLFDSDIRSPLRQRVGMVRIFVWNLRLEERYRTMAEKLIEYHERSGLWSERDIVDRS